MIGKHGEDVKDEDDEDEKNEKEVEDEEDKKLKVEKGEDELDELMGEEIALLGEDIEMQYERKDEHKLQSEPQGGLKDEKKDGKGELVEKEKYVEE